MSDNNTKPSFGKVLAIVALVVVLILGLATINRSTSQSSNVADVPATVETEEPTPAPAAAPATVEEATTEAPTSPSPEAPENEVTVEVTEEPVYGFDELPEQLVGNHGFGNGGNIGLYEGAILSCWDNDVEAIAAHIATLPGFYDAETDARVADTVTGIYDGALHSLRDAQEGNDLSELVERWGDTCTVNQSEITDEDLSNYEAHIYGEVDVTTPVDTFNEPCVPEGCDHEDGDGHTHDEDVEGESNNASHDANRGDDYFAGENWVYEEDPNATGEVVPNDKDYSAMLGPCQGLMYTEAYNTAFAEQIPAYEAYSGTTASAEFIAGWNDGFASMFANGVNVLLAGNCHTFDWFDPNLTDADIF